jgi:hypothetical protein
MKNRCKSDPLCTGFNKNASSTCFLSSSAPQNVISRDGTDYYYMTASKNLPKVKLFSDFDCKGTVKEIGLDYGSYAIQNNNVQYKSAMIPNSLRLMASDGANLKSYSVSSVYYNNNPVADVKVITQTDDAIQINFNEWASTRARWWVEPRLPCVVLTHYSGAYNLEVGPDTGDNIHFADGNTGIAPGGLASLYGMNNSITVLKMIPDSTLTVGMFENVGFGGRSFGVKRSSDPFAFRPNSIKIERNSQ